MRGFEASNCSSDSESSTTRLGLVSSTMVSTPLVIAPISISLGWKMLYCSAGSRMLSDGNTSWMCTPSSDQPCASATARNSTAVSDSVMYSAGSPSRAPSIRNCKASVVFPEPGEPSTRYSRSRVKPPRSTSSRPTMPLDKKVWVEVFCVVIRPSHAGNPEAPTSAPGIPEVIMPGIIQNCHQPYVPRYSKSRCAQ
jgi:hypothetical protein